MVFRKARAIDVRGLLLRPWWLQARNCHDVSDEKANLTARRKRRTLFRIAVKRLVVGCATCEIRSAGAEKTVFRLDVSRGGGGRLCESRGTPSIAASPMSSS